MKWLLRVRGVAVKLDDVPGEKGEEPYGAEPA